MLGPFEVLPCIELAAAAVASFEVVETDEAVAEVAVVEIDEVVVVPVEVPFGQVSRFQFRLDGDTLESWVQEFGYHLPDHPWEVIWAYPAVQNHPRSKELALKVD